MSNKARVYNGRILFSVVYTAINDADFFFTPIDPSATLVWFDTLKEMEDFSSIKPWQVVNRIPGINSLCRKVPFTMLLQRVLSLSASDVTFLPKSFILPRQYNELSTYFTNRGRSIIIKPDNGSLGQGISIVQPGNSLPRTSILSVAQELVDPFLLNMVKFDFRIYALVASISPLTIFVYRDGVARFCSESYSKKTLFSCITNTFVNKQKAPLDSITKMVAEVMTTLQDKGVNTDLLWKKIDKIIIITILSGIGVIEEASKMISNPSRCFQILGFDILIDSRQEPKILEVNYRPSLECGTSEERLMKRDMLSKSMKIAMGGWYEQSVVSSHRDDETRTKLLPPPPTRTFTAQPGFVQVFPPTDKNVYERYLRIMSEVKKLPSILTTEKLPVFVQVKPIRMVHRYPLRDCLPNLEQSESPVSGNNDQKNERKLKTSFKESRTPPQVSVSENNDQKEERQIMTSFKEIRTPPKVTSSVTASPSENVSGAVANVFKCPAISRPFTTFGHVSGSVPRSPSQSQFQKYLEMIKN